MSYVNSQSRELKQDALDLLEWALADMSPDAEHAIHFQCGFEREGHFIPFSFPAFDFHRVAWQIELKAQMDQYASRMNKALKENNDLSHIYHDPSGTFLLEGVTKPIGLRRAADAIDIISNDMLEEAKKLPMQSAAFGPVPFEPLTSLNNEAEQQGFGKDFMCRGMRNYNEEVFDIAGQGKILIGHGQHCNLSIWSGNLNLFDRTTSAEHAYELINNAIAKALEWMPYAYLCCRQENYNRIHGNCAFEATTFSAGNLNAKKDKQAVRYIVDQDDNGNAKKETFRFEFRQGASEADPLDVALASAAPLVKACDEVFIKDDHGKCLLSGVHPQLNRCRDFPLEYQDPAPRTQAEAKALFVSEHNPYFSYLNELAERRIKRAEEKCESEPGVVAQQELRTAQKSKAIGTKLYGIYCAEYNLPNRMPPANVLAKG